MEAPPVGGCSWVLGPSPRIQYICSCPSRGSPPGQEPVHSPRRLWPECGRSLLSPPRHIAALSSLARGAEFMGSNRLAGETAPQTWIPLPLLRIQLLNAAFLPSIGRREDRNNIFDFFETILVFLVVKCRLFLEVTWFLGELLFQVS